jgi:hypothetical protein
MAVLDSPPPVPANDPGDGPDDDDIDACAGAEKSSDPDLRAACNVWPSFSDRFGTRFNLIVDANSNGILDGPDLVDVHDVGDMQSFFDNPANRLLDSQANGNPAVGEYKEYLSAKLSLKPPLTLDNRFDGQTVAASAAYLCHGSLAKRDFDTIVKPGAEHGFQVLDQQSYERGRLFTTGRYAYVDAELVDASVSAGASVCIIGEDIEVGDVGVDEDATVSIQADTVTFTGNVTVAPRSSACATVKDGVVFAPGTTGTTVARSNAESSLWAAVLFVISMGSVSLPDAPGCRNEL